jgi:GNAT superfamily N-acetyltransferase
MAGTTALPWEYPTILFANMRSFAFTMPGSIFGYFSDDALPGAGELRLSGDQGTAAEAAFSVEPGWRRRCVGKELMARIVQAASNEG